MDEKGALAEAVRAGSFSPCAKSKRGVVIWSPIEGVVAWGWNAPPDGFRCDGSDECRASCGKVAVHAEQAALLACISKGVRARGLEMIHTKVVLVAGVWAGVFGGPPSCPDCSKLILEAGIAGMWLVEEREGRPTLVRYAADEFHRLTLQNCGLHPGR